MIHQSVSPDHATLGDVQTLRDWHVRVNGWRDVGYNKILDRIGARPEMVLGRPLTEDGAHTRELHLNRVGIGYCVIGNFDIAPPPEDSLALLRRHVLSDMLQYGIPVENVIGHGEAQAAGGVPIAERKTCPGLKFDMEAFRASLRPGVAVG